MPARPGGGRRVGTPVSALRSAPGRLQAARRRPAWCPRVLTLRCRRPRPGGRPPCRPDPAGSRYAARRQSDHRLRRHRFRRSPSLGGNGLQCPLGSFLFPGPGEPEFSVARSTSTSPSSPLRQAKPASSTGADTSFANSAMSSDRTSCRAVAIGSCGDGMKWSLRAAAAVSCVRAVSKSFFGLSIMVKPRAVSALSSAPV